MNIFVLDKDPTKIPKHMPDVHVRKMLLETAQILCAVHHRYNTKHVPYKNTHNNHPCVLWAGETYQNYRWLLLHGLSLITEYVERFGKRHKSSDVVMWCHNQRPAYIPFGDLTPWPQVMPDEYRSKISQFSPMTFEARKIRTIISYRRYYASKIRDFRKRGICKFTRK